MPGRAESPPGRDVAVVVPAYDVAATIRDVVIRIRRAVPDANMYVVDDGSTDGTGPRRGSTGLGRGRERSCWCTDAITVRGRRCSNWLSAALASRVGGVRVPDAQTGFRAMARSLAEAIRPAEHGYDFETAFLLAALAQGVRVRSVRVPTIYEVPGRGRGGSHFRSWADTWRQVRVFTRYGRQIIFGAR